MPGKQKKQVGAKAAMRIMAAAPAVNGQRCDFEAAMTITAAASADKCPRFDILAYTGGALRQMWSDLPIVVDLKGMTIPDSVPILSKHSTHLGGIGHTTKITNDGKQLQMSGDVSRDTEEAREFVASAKKGYPWKASIGCTVQQMSDVREGTVQVNGQTFNAPIRVAIKSTLYETSIVELPADAGTSVGVTATQEGTSPMKKKVKLFDGSEIEVAADATPEVIAALVTEAEKVIRAKATPPAPVVVPTPADPELQAQRDRKAAELARQAAIEAVAGVTPTIAAQAIKDGWTVERTELAVLRAARPQVPSVLVPSAPQVTNDVLAAAVCQVCGVGVEKAFKAETLEASGRAFRSGIGLKQLIVLVAQRAGFNGDPFLRGPTEIREALRAAFSTNEMASVLSNAANKMLMDAFNHVELSWQKIARINPNVNDFKAYDTYAFTGDTVFEKVGKEGAIPHGTLADEKYSNQLGTYAKMLGITRQDIINDDLGILAGRAAKLGRGAGLALNQVFWGKFLDNAAFFTAARGNLISGATTTLTSTGLGLADLAFAGLLGPDGQPLGATWKYLVVPFALRQAAMELQMSTVLNTGGSSTTDKVPNKNIWAGQFETVPTAYLSGLKDAKGKAATGTSAKRWYIISDPLDLPVIEVGFLRGATTPTVEEVAMDPHYLGIEMRGYFDFGVALQVWQAGVASKGEA